MVAKATHALRAGSTVIFRGINGYQTTCLNCGTEAVRKHKAKFCSDSCRFEYNRGKSEDNEHQLKIFGE